MPDNEFVKGLKIETKEGQYGEFIKGSINTEEIFNNPLNKDKWLNFMMFKSKAGKWYAVVSKPQDKQSNTIDSEEIPF